MLIHLSVQMNRAFSADVWDFVILGRCPSLLMKTAPSVLDTPQFYVNA